MNKLERKENLRENALEEQKLQEGSEEIQSVQTEVSEGAAEVLSGAEAPSEKVSESAKEESVAKTQTTGQKQMTEEERIRKVDEIVNNLDESQLKNRISKKYNSEIKRLKRKAFWLKFAPFSANRMNEIVARIRKLKERLRQLATMALEALRDLYRRILLKKD